MVSLLRRVVSGLLLLFAVSTSAVAQLRVAAASDLQPVLPALTEAFAARTGQPAVVTYGSSGTLATQMEHGAPFDVFLSADRDLAIRLTTTGVAVAASLTDLVEGRLVLWCRAVACPRAPDSIAALADRSFTRIAIANPDHAPYGRAAMAALEGAGVLTAVRPRLVIAESVAQAAQFVQSGNTDVGILALSTAMTPAMQQAGRFTVLPPDSYPPIRQAGITLARSAQPELGRRFLAFLSEPANIARLTSAGFAPLRR